MTDVAVRGVGPWARGEYPTPTATRYGTSQNEGQVSHKRPSSGTVSLDTFARMWPTPTASNASRGPSGDVEEGRYQHGRRLQDVAYQNGVLNPQFVEWLMGLPIGMTDSGPLGTEWFRWLQRMRFEYWRLGGREGG